MGQSLVKNHPEIKTPELISKMRSVCKIARRVLNKAIGEIEV